jgi:hypothetical protein
MTLAIIGTAVLLIAAILLLVARRRRTESRLSPAEPQLSRAEYVAIAEEGDALRKRGEWRAALDRLCSVAGALGAALDRETLPDATFLLMTEDLLITTEMGVLVYHDVAQPDGAVRLLRDAAKRARAAAKRCAATEGETWEKRAQSFDERADAVEHMERDLLDSVRFLTSLSAPSQRIARLFIRRILQLPVEVMEGSFQEQLLRACVDAVGPEIDSGAIDLSELLVRDGERIIKAALRASTIWPRHPLIRI